MVLSLTLPGQGYTQDEVVNDKFPVETSELSGRKRTCSCQQNRIFQLGAADSYRWPPPDVTFTRFLLLRILGKIIDFHIYIIFLLPLMQVFDCRFVFQYGFRT